MYIKKTATIPLAVYIESTGVMYDADVSKYRQKKLAGNGS